MAGTSPSIAHIIPLIRTPVGMDYFDFLIPSDLSIEPGDLVITPFRSSELIGLVIRTSDHSPHKDLKSIKAKLPIHFPEITIDLLQRTAERTFSSPPSVLKSWLGTIPKQVQKRLVEGTKQQRTTKRSKRIETVWSVNQRDQAIEQINESLEHGRVLCLTPWKDRLSFWQQQFPNAEFLTSDLNDTAFASSWMRFVQNESQLLFATRIGGWLSSIAETVILDEPENDDYKQDEMTPRYDARWMVRWCSERRDDVHMFVNGLTPPLHTSNQAPTIDCHLETLVYHPQGRSSVPLIQGEALRALTEHEGPKIIIHPIRGTRASITCRDCSWSATCNSCGHTLQVRDNRARCQHCGRTFDIPLTCSQCQGMRLERGLPGQTILQSAFKKSYPDIDVEWRDVSNLSIETPIPKNCCVLLTLPNLIAGGSEDIRRRERLIIAYRRLANYIRKTDGKLLIQTREDEAANWSEWLTTEGYNRFVEEEKRTRSMFKYPPSYKRIKLLGPGSPQQAEALLSTLKRSIPQLEWEGPWPTERSAATKRERMVIHGIAKHSQTDHDLIIWLRPFSDRALIDLDSIAFLR